MIIKVFVQFERVEVFDNGGAMLPPLVYQFWPFAICCPVDKQNIPILGSYYYLYVETMICGKRYVQLVPRLKQNLSITRLKTNFE